MTENGTRKSELLVRSAEQLAAAKRAIIRAGKLAREGGYHEAGLLWMAELERMLHAQGYHVTQAAEAALIEETVAPR